MQKTKSKAFLLGRKSGKKILAIFNLKFTLASLQKYIQTFKTYHFSAPRSGRKMLCIPLESSLPLVFIMVYNVIVRLLVFELSSEVYTSFKNAVFS